MKKKILIKYATYLIYLNKKKERILSQKKKKKKGKNRMIQFEGS